jgi:AraC-like DNA-binding protein
LPINEDLSLLDKKFIDQATKIVEDNIGNPDFAIEDLEREIGMSHASLYRKFKGLLGKTPLEFIQQYRLKKAMELLVSGNHNVNEVAYMVGFSDPKYFSTVFKKHYGKNASDYLKR